jgi:tetratricopeptide (TPR) repeat protein
MAKLGLGAGLALLALWTWSGLAAGHPPEATFDTDKDFADRQNARRGFELLMNGDLDAADSVFHEIQRSDPQSPLGYLLEADALWWKIYYSTAHLLDPDVFDVAAQDVSPFDSHFADLIRVATTRAEIRIRGQQDVARNTLYAGMAYALLARLDGLRGKDFATSRAGKKMHSALLSAVEMDPNLIDANLGLGTYDYYVDTLSVPLRLLRVLGSLPAGNRARGLQLLQMTAERGDLLCGEAKFYLAKDYSRPSEKKYRQSLELFQQLSRDYPQNPLWTLLSASLENHLGEATRADDLFRQVFKDTEKQSSPAERAAHQAAREVLVRQHPRESFAP